MEDIKEILKKYWGYEEFRSLQKEIIQSVIEGKDTLALMPTGGGKSITYQVSALAMRGICIVVTPLIALMKDQVEELHKRGIQAEAVYTGMLPGQIESSVNKTIAGKVKFLYISPERLASERFRLKLKQMPVCLLAVDEAHCISQWGYDFRPSYLKIAEVRSFFTNVPILALTATATSLVVEDIQKQLQFSTPHVLTKSFRRKNISYVVRKANNKLEELAYILNRIKACAIVYVRKRETAVELAKYLNAHGIVADYYHAGLSAMQREKKQENWKNNQVPVMVATNAFGMGIDKPDVRIVVHFDSPDSPEAYFQEAGRAGRDGKKAYAVLLYNEASYTAMKSRIQKEFPDKKYIRNVYQALGNYFQLGEGEGEGKAYEFDADVFVGNFKLDYRKTLSALKILQVSGYLECTTDVRAKSRICFLVMRDQLYKIDLDNTFQEQLMEFILRTYAGIFVQYIFIDEQLLADRLGVSRHQVYEALIIMAKRKIISYIPSNDWPYIVFHQPKLPPSYLLISKEAYEDRKLAYTSKVEYMLSYIKNTAVCRQLLLMEYFGQKETEPCGICDCCLNRKKIQVPGKTKETKEKLLALLAEKDMEIKELLRSFKENQDEIISLVRYLLDEGKIYYKTTTLLALKH